MSSTTMRYRAPPGSTRTTTCPLRLVISRTRLLATMFSGFIAVA
ncbi:hypothetical protein [Xanthomonas graminis]|nr:hypothetical protein [Xanthomonas translucens]